MGTPCVTSREALSALLSEHGGDITSAAASIGTSTAALYQRVRRSGLSMRVPRWPASEPAAAEPSNAFALAALELAVENQGLREALIGAEGVIDHLTGKLVALERERGARP